MKLGFFIRITVILLLILVSVIKSFSQDKEYYQYNQWKNEYDSAKSKRSKAIRTKTAFFAGGLIAVPVFSVLEQRILAGSSFIVTIVGYGAARIAQTKAEKEYRRLRYEGQQKDWFINPPTMEQESSTNQNEEPESKDNIKTLRERLELLNSLKDDGLITEEEYEQARKKIFEEMD